MLRWPQILGNKLNAQNVVIGGDKVIDFDKLKQSTNSIKELKNIRRNEYEKDFNAFKHLDC